MTVPKTKHETGWLGYEQAKRYANLLREQGAQDVYIQVSEGRFKVHWNDR